MLCVNFSFSQKLETVHSFAREIRDANWYQTQLNLWKAEVDKNKTIEFVNKINEKNLDKVAC